VAKHRGKRGDRRFAGGAITLERIATDLSDDIVEMTFWYECLKSEGKLRHPAFDSIRPEWVHDVVASNKIVAAWAKANGLVRNDAARWPRNTHFCKQLADVYRVVARVADGIGAS
jgi:hypothetical protein